MAAILTEVTEISTGLAMLGYQDLSRALEVRPRHISHVNEAVFERLEQAWESGDYATAFEASWENGIAFSRSPLGLRGRPPWTLEWKGHHKPASKSIEGIPADLRVDHVYLVSCKYNSRILHNAGPITLFAHGLAPSGPIRQVDWYEYVAEDAYRAVWKPLFKLVGLPDDVTPSSLEVHGRKQLRTWLRTTRVDTDHTTYVDFVREVSHQTAIRWQQQNRSARPRSELFWRLLRMQAAPYFVLGTDSKAQPVRYRVGTPWDFTQRYKISALQIEAGRRGQPSVDWTFSITDIHGATHSVRGHVEVRWSHGKFNGSPEAKVYLDTPVRDVPGYDSL